MRTCASSAPDTPGSRPRAASPRRGKSVVVLEARDRVGGRIWTQPLVRRFAGRPRRRVARRRSTTRSSRSRREVGVSTYKTWVKGAHLLVDGDRIRRYTGLIPKISPLAVVTIALAQLKIDRMAKQVPLDAPWDGEARRGVGLALGRLVARALGHPHRHRARPVRDGGARACSPATCTTCRSCTCCSSCAAHGSINTLFSIENGAQENMVDGGAGSIARRVADELGDAVRLSAPVRSIAQRDDRVVVDAGDARRVGAPRRRRDPARARAGDRVRSGAPRRPARCSTATTSPGPETKTLVVYDEPFWRADGFSGQTAEPGLGGRGDARRVARRRARRASSRRSRSDRSPRSSTRSIPPSGASAVLDALDAPPRPARRVTRRVHRDRVVEREVDARLLVGAPPPGHPHALRTAAPRAVRPRSTGPAPRRRRRRTARSTAPSVPASAPRPRSSTARDAAPGDVGSNDAGHAAGSTTLRH